jgi:hypothetical protein
MPRRRLLPPRGAPARRAGGIPATPAELPGVPNIPTTSPSGAGPSGPGHSGRRRQVLTKRHKPLNGASCRRSAGPFVSVHRVRRSLNTRSPGRRFPLRTVAGQPRRPQASGVGSTPAREESEVVTDDHDRTFRRWIAYAMHLGQSARSMVRITMCRSIRRVLRRPGRERHRGGRGTARRGPVR